MHVFKDKGERSGYLSSHRMPGHRIGPKASEKEFQIWKLPKLVPAVQHGQYSSSTMAESQVPG